MHASLILATIWSVYLYRDVWPLATVNETPVDLSEGKALWAKFALLSLAGVMIPLLTPWKPVYTEQCSGPAPEQTASILSLLTYAYLEPLIWKAWRIPRLTCEMLPPLAEVNQSEYLAERSSVYVDPLQRKTRLHFAFGLLCVFAFQLCYLAVLATMLAFASFAPPFAIKQLLVYMEGGGVGARMQLWFWIVLFFFGSTLRDILIQWYMFNYTRINIRVQAIVTDLVFKHSLRIRMKAGTPGIGRASEGLADQATPTTGGTHLDSDGESAGGNVQRDNASASEGRPSSSDVSPTKGKGKHTSSNNRVSGKSSFTKASQSSDGSSHLVGRINNLVSGDLRKLDEMGQYTVFFAAEWPAHVALCAVFLYNVLGWSALVGVAVTVLTLPLPGYLAKRVQNVHVEKMKRTDSRVQAVTEMLNVIRMIKLFGWEPRIAAQLDAKREAELEAVRQSKVLTCCIGLFNYALPYLAMLSTFFTYTVIMKRELTASAVFSSMPVFDMFRRAMQAFFLVLPLYMQGIVSLDRISDFLWNTELLDTYTNDASPSHPQCHSAIIREDEEESVIGIRHASFTWSRDDAPTGVPDGTHKRAVLLNVEDEVIFQPGKINLIVGPTGAGKTSLLMALLGEMHCIPTSPDSFVNLPREGGVAYAAQESWVQNDTIRNNIVFETPYEEVRYNKVLDQCALRHDLDLFDAGDETEVGEKGITLSGGQKARITLARAVYSMAKVLLLDDVFAALDVHTAKWIVERCIKGDLLHGRTVILVTHNVALVSPVVNFVVDIGLDGRILSQGSLDTALSRDSELLQEFEVEREVIEKASGDGGYEEKPSPEGAINRAGKLVVPEEMEDGHVGWSALKLFFVNISRNPVIFWFIYVSSNVTHNFLLNYQAWYLGHWALQYEKHPASEVSLRHYMTTYSVLIVFSMILAAFFVVRFYYGTIRASRVVHQKLIRSVLGTTLRWLDKTPTARIIARCTEDIQTVDEAFPNVVHVLTDRTVFTVLKLLAVVLFSPVFLIPALIVGALGGFLGNVYMKAQLSVKREMSNAKAPVLGHFSAAINGITSIRAYGAQEVFRKELFSRIDKYSKVAVMNENFNRWISARMDFIGTVFASSLAVYLVYVSHLNASDTGFSLNMAAGFSAMIFTVIRMFNSFELSGNLERIHQYLRTEQEPKATLDGMPPAYWPASGALVVQHLSARYSQDGPEILHDISFEVAPGERVGIVGRTGSGKARSQTSLTLALLRCIATEGEVFYDGLPISNVNLEALRSCVTIIPQVPELLSGTLRQNLDPFSEHDDCILNDALRSAGLHNIQTEGDRSRITLDTAIAGGGANLSVGQRQVLALARAIVRRSKLLILDEGMRTIQPNELDGMTDYETDATIQRCLRTEVEKDTTVLIVAHRLQTIMDADKIMVLDAGSLVEFGRPAELLHKEESLFRALVEESSERNQLYATAEGVESSRSMAR
ncbi:P-loop containing nucleoside triphosphate hydrolase protein [Trametes polyzona]|nr:P-loop containing nucleoside triphosphate hydrolase protein [Trametes polyzona]